MIWVTLTLILSIILEANYINIPLTFATLIFWTVTKQRSEIFIGAFLAGLLLDSLTFNTLGLSSAYFLLTILAIFLYRSKFEIKTTGFVGVIGFLGSLFYMILKGSENVFLGSILLTVILITSFQISYKVKSK